MTTSGAALRLGTTRGRGALAATVLASSLGFLDGTVVNVALPVIGRDLDAGLAALQWTVNGYLLALAALILLGGAVGDRYGRRRVFVVGVVAFAVTSALCAAAQEPVLLVVGRVLQGAAAALMTPTSLAVVQTTFAVEDRGKAIGLWAGWGGVAPALGPVVGGWLVGIDWRWAFLINLPLCVVVVVLALRYLPDDAHQAGTARLDLRGAGLAALALGGTTYALVAAAEEGLSAVVAASAAVGVVAGAAFVVDQLRSREPLVPPSLFADRTFSACNGLTLLVYAALGGLMFLQVLQLQLSLGWTPLQAGLAGLPSTLLLIVGSGRAGALAQRVGPRLPMVVGPALAAAGALLLAPLGPGDGYLLSVLPGVLLFGAGLVLVVAPLTATVLAAAPDALAGTASGVNNAVARAGSLLAVAALPAVIGLSGQSYADPAQLTPAYRLGMLLCAVLLAGGGLIALLALPRRAPRQRRGEPEVAPSPAAGV